MGKRLWIPGLCLIALLVVAAACGQPAPEASTATPVPATDPPAATEAVPTEESTAIPARPTPTAAPTGTELPATEPPPTEAPTATPGPTTAPVDEGRALLEERCTVCHTLDRVERSQKSREEWVSTVARMVENGAQLTDAERAVLIDYLAATYGS